MQMKAYQVRIKYKKELFQKWIIPNMEEWQCNCDISLSEFWEKVTFLFIVALNLFQGTNPWNSSTSFSAC